MYPLKFYHEIKNMYGEDAPPLIGKNYFGVFDGLGGSGTMKHKIDDEGMKTSAFIASRMVSNIVEKFFINKEEFIFTNEIEKISTKLKKDILGELKKFTQEKNLHLSSRVKSQMLKLLPTTMATAICREFDDEIEVMIFWAGDSRVYILNAETGLSQLTSDDITIEQDALQNIYHDAPISNVINLSSDFKINCQRVIIKKPAIIFAATDGVFNYYDSPMAFEESLLDSLINQECRSFEDWMELIYENVIKVTADDATFSGGVFGYDMIDELRMDCSKRADELRDFYSKPYELKKKVLENHEFYKEKESETFISKIKYEIKYDSIQNILSEYKLSKESFDSQRFLFLESRRVKLIDDLKGILRRKHIELIFEKSWNDLNETEKKLRKAYDEKVEIEQRRKRSVMMNKNFIHMTVEIFNDLLNRIENCKCSIKDADQFNIALTCFEKSKSFIKLNIEGDLNFHQQTRDLDLKIQSIKEELHVDIDEKLDEEIGQLINSKVNQLSQRDDFCHLFNKEYTQLTEKIDSLLNQWKKRFKSEFDYDSSDTLQRDKERLIDEMWRVYRVNYEIYLLGGVDNGNN